MDPLEITGFIFGVAGVLLTARRVIWCFPVGIVNVLITAWLVFNQALYADALQQLVYFVLLVAGWIRWRRARDAAGDPAVSRLAPKEALFLASVFLAGGALMGFLFSRYTAAAYPYWDSGATALCFIAQWLIARRKIENWLLWMAANPVYVVLYLLKDLDWYALLSVIYFGLAVAGWRLWHRRLRQTDGNR
jgi:nicotinamide mononucleotide transporter